MGDIIQVSQATVSRIVFRVSILIARYINQYIKMPISDETRSKNKRLFKEHGYGPRAIGFPCIDGAIDCTHIRLIHRRFQAIDEVFGNRKGYFSLNVQVCIYISIIKKSCVRILYKYTYYFIYIHIDTFILLISFISH